MLLTSSLTPLMDRLHPDGNYYIGADNGIYWRRTENPLEGCKAPDWFYVPNVPRLLNGVLRRSYVLWQELVHPLVVIEYVSRDGSEERDATPEKGKFWVYEQIIQPTYYVIYDPDQEELSVFELVHGQFQPLSPTDAGRFRITPMEIDFGIWQGEYLGAPASWLRAWDWKGKLILTAEELLEIEKQSAEQERTRAEQERTRAEQERTRAEQERTRAEQERTRAERECTRAEKLAARLRELGVDPESV
jgi:Uma2 family endonuclease